MIQTMWGAMPTMAKKNGLVKNDYVTVTFRPKSSGALELIILFSEDTPYVKTEAAQQGASEAMYSRRMRLPRQQCSSLLEPCFSRELPN